MKPVCIVGLGPSAESAPFGGEYELWGLPWSHLAARCDTLFEIHREEVWPDNGAYLAQNCVSRLEELGLPVYMQTGRMDVPLSLAYPLNEVVESLGRDYFGSSVAFMIALAIMQKREEIALFGVDLSGDVYDHQKPNLAWLCGLAEGRGIILTGPSLDCILPVGKRYGWAA